MDRTYDVARRGKFQTLVDAETGRPVTVFLSKCPVVTPPHVSATVDKTFMTVRVQRTSEGSTLCAVDQSIKQHVRGGIGYEPYSGDMLVVKIPQKCLIDVHIEKGDVVDMSLTLGNFGSFGYCWLADVVAKTGF